MSSYTPPKIINGKKTFTVLENNPEILTHLAHTYGASPTLSFTDVYSLNEPSLLALVPRPVLALIAIIPFTPTWGDVRKEEDENPSTYPDHASLDHEDGIVWFKQTIGEACGTYALVHSLLNLPKSYIKPDSILAKIRDDASGLKNELVEERARLLYDNKEIEVAHQEAAVQGVSEVPEIGEDTGVGHFIAFIKKNGRLWELEGSRKGPIDRGALNEDEDVLSKRAIEQGTGRVIALKGGIDLRFSLVALVEDQKV